MKAVTRSLFLIISLALVQSALAGQADPMTARLELHIKGFANSKGVAMVALADSRENYEAEGNPYMGFIFRIMNRQVKQSIMIPRGEYAIKVYHDENKNNEMDTLVFGIPSEKYGFSNDARGVFGPPDFEAAKFTVGADTHEITITVQ